MARTTPQIFAAKNLLFGPSLDRVVLLAGKPLTAAFAEAHKLDGKIIDKMLADGRLTQKAPEPVAEGDDEDEQA